MPRTCADAAAQVRCGRTAKRRHPAKGAPAKAPAKKATTSAAKISWKPEGEKNAKGEYDRSVGTCGDATYTITRQADGSFKATVKQGGKTSVVAENAKSGNAAWAACVAHSKGAAA